jgi:hypothetical protein
MGTRADFWIGVGETAEWIGSVGWDGYEWAQNPECDLRTAFKPEEFRAAVAAIAESRKDFTSPEEGWPWPWDTSHTTDYAYCLTPAGVRIFSFGEDIVNSQRGEFPNMKDRKNVQFGAKSGAIIVGG